VPEAITVVNGLAENLRLQDRAAQRMKDFRHVHGALSLETIEAKPIFDGDQIRDLQVEGKNRAKDITEDFMIAANGVTARYLSSKNLPSIRHVVRTPKRWERIVEIAGEHGLRLPDRPDVKALEAFLIKEKTADPLLPFSCDRESGSGLTPWSQARPSKAHGYGCSMFRWRASWCKGTRAQTSATGCACN
jgi:exoribonuclease-2